MVIHSHCCPLQSFQRLLHLTPCLIEIIIELCRSGTVGYVLYFVRLLMWYTKFWPWSWPSICLCFLRGSGDSTKKHGSTLYPIWVLAATTDNFQFIHLWQSCSFFHFTTKQWNSMLSWFWKNWEMNVKNLWMMNINCVLNIPFCVSLCVITVPHTQHYF